MVKAPSTKLKNTAISFWCFLAILLSHAEMMGWMDILEFTVDSATVNLLKTFALVPLEMVILRRDALILAAKTATASTRAATGGTAGGPIVPTAA